MRLFIFILILLVTTSIVAQKRATIFKKIHSYRDSIYNKATYQTDSLDFAYAINKYLLKDGFAYVDKTNAYDLYYQKLVYLMCSPPPKGQKYRLSGGKVGMCKVAAYVLIDVIDTNEAFSFVLNVRTEEYSRQFLQQPSILGQYKFDEAALKEHLYLYYYGSKPKLPSVLLAEIEKYNAKQKQEDKKIIEGRNY